MYVQYCSGTVVCVETHGGSNWIKSDQIGSNKTENLQYQIYEQLQWINRMMAEKNAELDNIVVRLYGNELNLIKQ